jgi:hypothetical protein
MLDGHPRQHENQMFVLTLCFVYALHTISATAAARGKENKNTQSDNPIPVVPNISWNKGT